MMHIVELNYYELHLKIVKILDDLTNGVQVHNIT